MYKKNCFGIFKYFYNIKIHMVYIQKKKKKTVLGFSYADVILIFRWKVSPLYQSKFINSKQSQPAPCQLLGVYWCR